MPQPQAASVLQPIRRLPPHLANQIAAGEVVERPASIVKELVENSLDAEARRITVILKQGGVQFISVQDDGLGIPADELPLALAAHATSKISQVEDLAAITSMGFRGEALASIGSVAHLQITTRTHTAERGWTVYGPEASDPVPAAHPPGTTVTVQELFFNTPARRRFLRSERTEYRHCEDVIRRMALSRFDVAFVLQHNQRTVFNLPVALDPAARQQRVMRLCGRSFIQHAVAVEFQHGEMRLEGWLGLPTAARPQADLQYFFVNGRMIRDRVINHALRQAFADRLYPGRYPAYVLNLTLDPAEVDVNVHPTKHEVRFHQGRLVHDFLVHCVEDALGQQGDRSTLPYAREPLDWHVPAGGNVPGEARSSSLQLAEPTANPAYDSTPSAPLGKVLAVIQDRFALYQHPAGLLLIDVARLYRNYLSGQFQALTEHDIPRRPLLIPLNIKLAMDTTWFEQQLDIFDQAGFDFGISGQHSVILRRCPVLLEHLDFARFVPAWLGELVQQESLDLANVLEALIRLAPDFIATPWQESQLSPLLNWLIETGSPLVHPAVAVLDQTTLASLFRP